MTRAGADDEMGVGKLALDAPGHRQRRRRVVVTPDELDRASHRSDRGRVVLGERSHENVSHDAGGGAVVVRAVTLAEGLDLFLAEPVCGKEARDPEAEWRARPSPGGPVQRHTAQHEAGNTVRPARRQVHGDAAPERMPEHDDPRRHLVEHRRHGVRVLRRSPHLLGRRCAAEPRQVQGDRVDARRGEDGGEVLVVPAPSVQREDPGRPLAVGLPEQAGAPANDVSIAKKLMPSPAPEPHPARDTWPDPARYPPGTVS